MFFLNIDIAVLIVVAGMLMILESIFRLFLYDNVIIKSRKDIWKFIIYIIVSIMPLVVFTESKVYLPVFYTAFILRLKLQEVVFPISYVRADECLRIKFIFFGSINLLVIGLTVYIGLCNITDFFIYPKLFLFSVIISETIIIILKYVKIKTTFQIDLKIDKSRELEGYYWFLNLAVIYIFEQSIFTMFIEEDINNLEFFFIGNIVTIALAASYLYVLYRINGNVQLEDSNKYLQEIVSKKDIELKELMKNAHFDQLTGARTRLYLIQESSMLLDKQIPFALVYIDLNGLKKINDTYGHQEGDKYLRNFAMYVQQKIRQEDTLSRFGGDEFILLLPESNRLEAEICVNRIREYIAEVSDKYEFSAGWTDTSEEKNLENMIALADLRMYKNKEEWRKKDGN